MQDIMQVKSGSIIRISQHVMKIQSPHRLSAQHGTCVVSDVAPRQPLQWPNDPQMLWRSTLALGPQQIAASCANKNGFKIL